MGSQPEIWSEDREFASRVESLAGLRRFLGDALRPLRLAAGLCDQMVLAAHETAANLIRHASIGAGAGFGVRLERAGCCLTIRFTYVGADFDPSAVAPPSFDGSREGGFGLYLIGLCVDSVTYDRDESGARRVTLIRRFGELDVLER